MKELWKAILNWPGYEVSSQGRVRSFKKLVGRNTWAIAKTPQRILAGGLSNGYRVVTLSQDGIQRTYRIANLVLAAFMGSAPEGMEVCHTDCNPLNDKLENLRYDSPGANARDGVGKHVANRLTNKQAVQLRQLAAEGLSDQELASRFSVSINTVSACRLGRTFAYLRGPLTKRTQGSKRGHKGYKLTKDEIRQMRRDGQKRNVTIIELAKRYGVHVSHVSLILRGLRCKEMGGPISISRYRGAKSTV